MLERTFLIFPTHKDSLTRLLFQHCNYILFTKLPWPGDSKGTFRSSSQAATCPVPTCQPHTAELRTVPLIAERQAGKL